jgi:hypothetical protein
LAQDGAFTIHSNPWKSIESYERERSPFKVENLDIERLYRWRVPAEEKANILKDLSSLGVTKRSLFPDLDGVAESLLGNGGLVERQIKVLQRRLPVLAHLGRRWARVAVVVGAI